MPELTDHTRRLLRVGKAKKDQLAEWAEGVSLSSTFGLTIHDLKLKAATERWKLALEHRREGNLLLALPRPPYRAVVSRFYYVMYHAMRAACFLHHAGDDFEAHSDLPKNLPSDFPQVATWSNNLKGARLNRNAADYDPYPKSQIVWRRRADTVKADAGLLLTEVRAYLKSKGCTSV